MVRICATKDKKLWHIRKTETQTYCGQGDIDMFADIDEIPDDKSNYCPQCLANYDKGS